MTAHDEGPPSDTDTEPQRIDKWLWCARFFKTRSLATHVCLSGKVRLNGNRIAKAHAPVRPGDVLTFTLGDHVRVIRVRATAVRRGPAVEAQSLYEDMEPPAPRTKKQTAPPSTAPGQRERGRGRPTKRDRRAFDTLTGGD